MSVCLTHSCLERMTENLSSVSTSRACDWVPVTHPLQPQSLLGSGHFLISLHCTVKIHCLWPFSENVGGFSLNPLLSFCWMPSLYAVTSCISSTRPEPHHMSTYMKGLLFTLSFLLFCTKWTKWTSLQTPGCCRDKLLLLWSVFSSSLCSFQALGRVCRQLSTSPSQLISPTWAPCLLAGCVKYISKQSSRTIPWCNIPFCGYLSIQSMPHSGQRKDYSVCEGQKHITVNRILNLKLILLLGLNLKLLVFFFRCLP